MKIKQKPACNFIKADLFDTALKNNLVQYERAPPLHHLQLTSIDAGYLTSI
jgi:hypothetical protein